MIARECESAANQRCAPARRIDVCLTPAGVLDPRSPNRIRHLPIQPQHLKPPSRLVQAPAPAPCFGVLGDQNPFEIHSRECQRLRSNGLIEAAPAAADNRNPETVAPGQPR